MDISVMFELEKIREKEKLSRKDVENYLDAFCSQVAIIFDAAMEGRFLASRHYPNERVNRVMSNIEVERCLAHFEVMDAVIEKLGGIPTLKDHASSMFRKLDERQERLWKLERK